MLPWSEGPFCDILIECDGKANAQAYVSSAPSGIPLLALRPFQGVHATSPDLALIPGMALYFRLVARSSG